MSCTQDPIFSTIYEIVTNVPKWRITCSNQKTWTIKLCLRKLLGRQGQDFEAVKTRARVRSSDRYLVRESRNQFAGTLLLVLTVVGIVGAVLSFMHLRSYPLHDDGVTWVDVAADQKTSALGNRVAAAYLTPGGSGERAGIRVGDQLVRIQDFPIQDALDVPRVLWRIPLFERTRYTLRRDGIEFQKDNIYIQSAPRDNALYYQYVVGVFYLAIGLFVYYRRTSASNSRQFFLLCLASFGACCFHYSGYLNTFDEVMYWGNVAMHLLAPAIFLHFCLTFHAKPKFLERSGAVTLLYVPSALLFAVLVASATGLVRFSSSLLEIRWLFVRFRSGVRNRALLHRCRSAGFGFKKHRRPRAAAPVEISA